MLDMCRAGVSERRLPNGASLGKRNNKGQAIYLATRTISSLGPKRPGDHHISGWQFRKEAVTPFYPTWVDEASPVAGLVLLAEKAGARAGALDAIQEAVRDHIVGAELLARLGFREAAEEVAANIPYAKRTRSGDLGEILGTEYVLQRLGFSVPLKRLRHKEDPDLPMRGDDIIAFRRAGARLKVLKAECKSRATLDAATVEAAVQVLDKHASRPNPRTLAFLRRTLLHFNRFEEAADIKRLLDNPHPLQDVEHLVFTFSGNDPGPLLGGVPAAEGPKRHIVGLRVPDHQDFIRTVFEGLEHARGR